MSNQISGKFVLQITWKPACAQMERTINYSAQKELPDELGKKNALAKRNPDCTRLIVVLQQDLFAGVLTPVFHPCGMVVASGITTILWAKQARNHIGDSLAEFAPR